MKSCYFFIVLITIIISCNTKKSEEEDSNIDTAVKVIAADTANLKTDSHYFWSSELDPKKGLVMIRTLPISTDLLISAKLIQMINDVYPEIQLQFIKISNDSIFVKINKSGYLTQQMGSSGAEAYLAEVTYNLTELNGINCVDIRFKAGDHASPGTYTRTDFVR